MITKEKIDEYEILLTDLCSRADFDDNNYPDTDEDDPELMQLEDQAAEAAGNPHGGWHRRQGSTCPGTCTESRGTTFQPQIPPDAVLEDEQMSVLSTPRVPRLRGSLMGECRQTFRGGE